MYGSQQSFRSLYEALFDYEGEDVHRDVLSTWLAKNDEERRFLDAFSRAPREQNWPPATREELSRLYAASRVNDVLRRCFEPPSEHASSWAGPALGREDYVRFMNGLGFHVVEHPSFDPFFHEIVGVSSSPEGPVRVTETYWPALFLGDMLFSRAGCAVVGPRDVIDPEIATTSLLHWAIGRRNRKTFDLSVGWGGNSQWRTSFRRDYRVGAMQHFNVDGPLDVRAKNTGRQPNSAREDLSPDERIELLTHRAFVRTAKPDDDLWPWDDRFSTVG